MYIYINDAKISAILGPKVILSFTTTVRVPNLANKNIGHLGQIPTEIKSSELSLTSKTIILPLLDRLNNCSWI